MKQYTIAQVAKMLRRGDRGVRELAAENEVGTVDPANGWGKRLFTEADIERMKELFAQRDAQVAANKRGRSKMRSIDPTWICTKDAGQMMTPPIMPATFLRRTREMGIAPAFVTEGKDHRAYWKPADVERVRTEYDALIHGKAKKKIIGVAMLKPAEKKVIQPATGEAYTETSLHGARYLQLAQASRPFDWRDAPMYGKRSE